MNWSVSLARKFQSTPNQKRIFQDPNKHVGNFRTSRNWASGLGGFDEALSLAVLDAEGIAIRRDGLAKKKIKINCAMLDFLFHFITRKKNPKNPKDMNR